MSMHPCVELVALASARPVMAYRPAYFLDVRYRDERGRPLYDLHPHHEGEPVAKPVEFTRPGLDVGAVLAAHLNVG